MGGIGSGVNDLTEAQHLLAPLFMVMMMLFVPAVFAIPFPESGVVVATSLLPPTSSAVMAARLTSSVPPPHWQVWIALLTSAGFAALLVFAAGRLLRVGLLLRGSPPNMRTLIRWVLTG
jgi:ABC-2 type transport system permease protein